MNKYYVIVPGALLLVFLGFERSFEKKRALEEYIRTEVALAISALEEEERYNQQLAAQRDAEKRAADRERQDRERADKKRRDYESMIASLQTQADEQTSEAAKLTDEIGQLTARLGHLRTKREDTERGTFELAMNTEVRRIERRKAELEVQRMTTMVAARLDESSWANPFPAVSPIQGR